MNKRISVSLLPGLLNEILTLQYYHTILSSVEYQSIISEYLKEKLAIAATLTVAKSTLIYVRLA